MAKTVKLDDIKAAANQVFRDSRNEYRQGRNAIHLLVADLLMKRGEYRGFRYLEASDNLPPDYKVGLIRNPECPEGPHQFPDDSRIAFL